MMRRLPLSVKQLAASSASPKLFSLGLHIGWIRREMDVQLEPRKSVLISLDQMYMALYVEMYETPNQCMSDTLIIVKRPACR
jgi:hypothetical protein